MNPYLYDDEDNQPMHEEHFPPEDKGCKQCPRQMWCEVRERNKTDYQSCEEFKLINAWWNAKIEGSRDADREEIPFADEDDFTLADLEED